jgi:predicted component of type VI protein secretion system
MSTSAPDLHPAVQQRTQVLDPLPRLDLRARRRAVRFERPPAGRYLALESEGETTLIEIDRTITHVGRSFAVDLRLDEQGVSRRHAIIVRRAGGTRILDDRSANGTYVNGRRVSDAPLQHGDVIVLGRMVMTYLEVADRPQAPAQRAASPDS